MTTDPELTRIVRSWLAEGVSDVPDRVLDSVMAELPATPQRRRWLPAWRDRSMNTYMRFAAAAIVVAVLVIGGISVARPGLIGGQATPVTSPSGSPTKLLPLAPVAWCLYQERDDVLAAPPEPYSGALAAAVDRDDPTEWRRVGPEYLALVRSARSALGGLAGLAPVAAEVTREASGVDAWIAALEASLAPGAGVAEGQRVYDAWEAWSAARIDFINAMRLNFETACP
ncbi:MAG: hypothetical protein WEF51_05350 [Chloroflexota bacterium]